MNPRKHSGSSISVFQIIAMVVLLLIGLIGLALMLAPRKPMAPPTSRITYENLPEERPKRDEDTDPVAAPESSLAMSPPTAAPLEGEEQSAEVATPVPASFNIRGTVTASSDGKPIRNAQVSAALRGFKLSPVQPAIMGRAPVRRTAEPAFQALTAKTNAEGVYTLEVKEPGAYTVEILAVGYVKFSGESAALSESAPEATVNASLSQGARISGRVTEVGSNQGAGGLRVRVESPDGPFSVTDNEGRYSISGMTEGQIGVAVDLRGSPYMVGRDLPYTRVTIPSADAHVEGVDFSVDPAGIVWGYVLSPDREPIPQANVVLTSSDSLLAQALNSIALRTPPLSDTTGPDGYYELAGVPLNSQWCVHAMTDEYAPQLSDPFLLTTAQRNARIDIYMFAGTNVYGVVVSTHGDPIPGAEVACLPAYSKFFSAMTAPQAFRSASTDRNGQFTLLELPAGEYQVFAQKQGYKIAPVGFPIYPDGYSDLRNVRITLRPADEGDHTVYGVVVDDRGQGIDGAELRLAGVSMGGFEASDRSATSANNGAFRFDGVSTGQYSLMVNKEGYSPTTVRRVRLNEEIRVLLRQSARVRGRVVATDSTKPLEVYEVAAYPISESTGAINLMGMVGEAARSNTFYNPDGSFELIVNAGAYRLEASASGYTPARADISVAAGQLLDGIVLTLEDEGGRIAGTVYASDGSSVQGAEVILLEASSPAEAMVMLASGAIPANRSARVGEDGAFAFENLPAGAYVAIAQHPNYPTAQSDLIQMPSGGKEENVRIRFGSGGAIEGFVYRERQPSPGAVVVVVGNGVTKHTTTDNTGYYYLDGLASGVYQAMVTEVAQGDLSSIYDARGVQVVVEEGKATRYDFGTSEGARIEGRCMPGPMNMLGGRAVLQTPGVMQTPLGETVEVTQLLGQSVGINPRGDFVMEDVPAGEWQLDIYYFELGVANPLDVRYVHTEFIQVTEGEVLTLNLPIQY